MKENEFKPSKYNLAIFDYVKNGVGNLVVGAAAGSGKTRTLLEIIKLLDKQSKILVSAFNNDIVDELDKRIEDKTNITVKTVHSLGYAMLMRQFGKLKLEKFKYRTYIYKNIKKFGIKNYILSNKDKLLEYVDNVSKLIDFARNYLASTNEEIEKIAFEHNIDIIDNEVNTVISLLKWGTNVKDEIDFIDMVWLPNVLNITNINFQYDYILLDECQDLSNAQRELIFKFKKLGTRYFFFGDKNQCLYAFSSASSEAFEYLCNMPNTVLLPLSISYRCPKKIVKFAQKIVSTIEYADNAENGVINFKANIDNINNGDMVLCRTNAPLMEMYGKLITSGKQCYIRGNDIGKNLIQMIKRTNENILSLDLKHDGVIPKLYKHLFEKIDKLQKTKGFSEKQVLTVDIIRNELDSIRTIELLSNDVIDAKELIKKISSIFKDDKSIKDSISLSTIHKAKGLEADNVFIIKQPIFDEKENMFDWEIQQEDNIKYVAYTRAKKSLNFIEIEQIADNKEKQLSLNDIRVLINKLYFANFGLSSNEVNKLISKNKNALKPSKIKLNVDRTETSKIGFETNKETNFSKLKPKLKKI